MWYRWDLQRTVSSFITIRVVEINLLSTLQLTHWTSSDVIWRYGTWWTSVYVMGWCLMAPSCYLYQCWLISSIHLRVTSQEVGMRDGRRACGRLVHTLTLQNIYLWNRLTACQWGPTQITKFMGPTWGPPGSCRSQMGPMLAPWTLLSGKVCGIHTWNRWTIFPWRSVEFL